MLFPKNWPPSAFVSAVDVYSKLVQYMLYELASHDRVVDSTLLTDTSPWNRIRSRRCGLQLILMMGRWD